MDLVSVALSTALTVVIMVALYHGWIIPRVVNSIKMELPEAIGAIVSGLVDDVKAHLSETIVNKTASLSDSLAEVIELKSMSLIKSYAGTKGHQARLVTMAERFLAKNGVTDDTLAQALDKYGQETIEKLVAKSKPSGGTPAEGVNWV